MDQVRNIRRQRFRQEQCSDARRSRVGTAQPHNGISNIGRKARELLNCCEDGHDACKYWRNEISMPRRILYIHDNPVRLIHTNNMEFKRYATLSYCWGPDKQEHQLTTKNEFFYLKGIPETKFPKTLKDTIALLRSIQIDYVWIDSLCILQDSLADWYHESRRMYETYSSAYVCISALCAWSSTTGLIGEQRNLHTESSRELYGRSSFISMFDSFPLNHRCWTLQERLLSQRLLHVTTSDIWLECRADLVRYNYQNDTFKVERPVCSGAFLELSKFARIISQLSGKKEMIEAEILASWYQVVMEYCPRKLSHESDRLIAIDGIKNLYQTYMDCDYIWGMWEGDIYNGLLWFNGMQKETIISSCIVDPLSVPLFHLHEPEGAENPAFYTSMIFAESSDRRLYKENGYSRSYDCSKSTHVYEHVLGGAFPSWSWAAAGSTHISFCYIDSQKRVTRSGQSFKRLGLLVCKILHVSINDVMRPCLEVEGIIAEIRIDRSNYGYIISEFGYCTQYGNKHYETDGRSNIFFDKGEDGAVSTCVALLVYQSGFGNKLPDRPHHTLLLLEEVPEHEVLDGLKLFQRIGIAFYEMSYADPGFLAHAHVGCEKKERLYLI